MSGGYGLCGHLFMCTRQCLSNASQPLVWGFLLCPVWGELSLLIDPSSLTCTVNPQCRRRPRRAPRRPRSRRPRRRRPRRPRRRRRRPRRRSERGFTEPPGLDPHRRLSAPPSLHSRPPPDLTLPCFWVGLSGAVHSTGRLFGLVRPYHSGTKADSTRRFSRAVPHRGTNRAFRCLTSEFKWDRVFSTKYGRQRRHGR